MKTDKFERTIRRKLESITPEFQEDDWTKMQHYMHAHTPPTFWQQYGSWLGYAAAAAVTSVMAFLYVNQLSQNNDLLTDVKALKSQIEVIKNAPAVIQKTDTVYIVQQQEAGKNLPHDPYGSEQRIIPQQKIVQESVVNLAEKENLGGKNLNNTVGTKKGTAAHVDYDAPGLNNNHEALANRDIPDNDPFSETIVIAAEIKSENFQGKLNVDHGGLTSNSGNTERINRNKAESANSGTGNVMAGENNEAGLNNPANAIAVSKTLDSRFDALEILAPVQENNTLTLSRRMNYRLARQISPGHVRSALLASNTNGAQMPVSGKKAASTKKAVTTIPRLNLKVPYRFGFAQHWEGKNQAKTIVAEVIVAKRFSISTGLSWLKIKPKDFYSEKSYREKTKRNFREDYNPQLMPFEGISNINVKPSVIQIPLTVAYRNDLKNDFAFFAGAGTNFTVKQKQDVAFDCYRDFYNPTNPKPTIIREIRHEQVTREMNLNLVNSLSFSAGMEKSWHPIVVQAEGYLYTYFSPLSPQSSKSGPGFKIKLLYQIGKKM